MTSAAARELTRPEVCEARRLRAAELFAQGRRPAEVAEMVGVTYEAARRWRASWTRGGVQELRRRRLKLLPVPQRHRDRDDLHEPAQRDAAKAAPLGTIPYGSNEKFQQQGGYFMEEVRRTLMKEYGEKAEDGPNSVYAGGLWVRTSMVPVMQDAAAEALREGLATFDGGRGWRCNLRIGRCFRFHSTLQECRRAATMDHRISS